MEKDERGWRRSCRLGESDEIPIDPVQKYSDPPVGVTIAVDPSTGAKSDAKLHVVASDGDATVEKKP